MTIEQIIETRRSVRTFLATEPSHEQLLTMENAISTAWDEAKGRVSFALAEISEDFRPSTYGVIKGASRFILMAYDKTDIYDCLRAGFLMERIVLTATSTGLGTCWIGGTFRQKSFTSAIRPNAGQTLNIVVPFGLPAPRRRLLEKISSAIARSRSRKPFGELFFENDFSSPLSSGNRFAHALAMMRLAPSAVNEQPWRAVVCDRKVHFYFAHKSEFSSIDLGIGLCHFNDTFLSHGDSGKWILDTNSPACPDGISYACTFKEEIC